MSAAEVKFQCALAEIRVRNTLQFESLNKAEGNICMCTVCGWTDTGESFSQPTGGDDYFGQCPKCFSPEEHIIDLID